MKILWTVSNWKRTGPVEPSLDLAAALGRRGHEVHVAFGSAPRGNPNGVRACVERRGLVETTSGARLHKHAAPWRDLPDIARLRRHVAELEPDVVVTTLRNDHALARRATPGRTGPPVVRLWFGDGTETVPRREAAALTGSDAVVVFGARPLDRMRHLGVDALRIHRLDPPLDVAGLRARVGDRDRVRTAWGADEGVFLFGIVARIQRHRRFELLWEAVDRARREAPPFRVVVIGRGTHIEEVARAPVAAMGLEEVVHFAGYLQGGAYVTMLAALDTQLFLVPGSDPTCRALREGMALGVPSLTTRRGLLPELVEDGATGHLFDEDPDALARALVHVAADPAAAGALGRAAAEAAARFDAADVAGRLEGILAGVRA